MQANTHATIDCRRNLSAMTRFLNVLEDAKNIFSKELFISRYSIRDLHAHDDRFWEICGGSVKTLTLDDVTFTSADAFRLAIFQSCPKLETLYLFNVKVYGDNGQEPLEWVPPRHPQNGNLKNLRVYINHERKNLGVTWMEIMSHFPSLENLNASAVCETSDELFRSLTLCRMHNRECWKLKTLKIHLSLLQRPLEFAELFVQSNFALDSFEFQGLGRADQLAVIGKILSSQSATLTNLTLRISKEPLTPWREILPLLNHALFERLTHLSIRYCPLPSARFLRFMPNLTRLELKYTSPEFENDETVDDPWVNNSCRELELCLVNSFKVGDLRRLQKRLPNVEQLKISHCNNQLFSVVCEYWSAVRSLKLDFNYVDEIGVSGLDLEDVERMNEDVKWRPVTVSRANLSALKSLEKLDIAHPFGSTLNPERVFFFDGLLQVNWLTSPDGLMWTRH